MSRYRVPSVRQKAGITGSIWDRYHIECHAAILLNMDATSFFYFYFYVLILTLPILECITTKTHNFARAAPPAPASFRVGCCGSGRGEIMPDLTKRLSSSRAIDIMCTSSGPSAIRKVRSAAHM